MKKVNDSTNLSFEINLFSYLDAVRLSLSCYRKRLGH